MAAGKSLHYTNKRIEAYLVEREKPFDFMSDLAPSAVNHWAKHVLKVLRKDTKEHAGWSLDDAHRWLQILCVDKRRNNNLAVKRDARPMPALVRLYKKTRGWKYVFGLYRVSLITCGEVSGPGNFEFCVY